MTRRWESSMTLPALACGSSSASRSTRSAEPLWRRYRRAKARIYGHPEVATRLGDVSGFQPVTGGGVGGAARFHPIGSPPRSEQPIEIPAHRALVFGDAVVETGGGELRVWEDPLGSE